MSGQSHVESFLSNFYTKGCSEIAKRVVKSCVICQLNSVNYNQKTSGITRGESLNTSPGEIVYVDSIHLNSTSAGFKFCVVFVDRVTSYLTAVPVKALKVENILEAVRTYLSIMPFPRVFKSDLGPEYSLKFTTGLSRYGILHEGLLPNRSNQQGNIEVGIKLLRGMLSKLVALNKFGGRDEWTTSLPVVVKNINKSCAYGSPLSRSALQFSPFHHSNPH